MAFDLNAVFRACLKLACNWGKIKLIRHSLHYFGAFFSNRVSRVTLMVLLKPVHIIMTSNQVLPIKLSKIVHKHV